MDLPDALNIELNALQNKLKNTIKEDQNRQEDAINLQKQTEKLDTKADEFRVEARETKNKFANKWWKIVGVILIIILILYFIKKLM